MTQTLGASGWYVAGTIENASAPPIDPKPLRLQIRDRGQPIRHLRRADAPQALRGFGIAEPERSLCTARHQIIGAGAGHDPACLYGRSYDEGKKIDWKDGIKALWYLLKFRLA